MASYYFSWTHSTPILTQTLFPIGGGIGRTMGRAFGCGPCIATTSGRLTSWRIAVPGASLPNDLAYGHVL